jgi:hypothetical protein
MSSFENEGAHCSYSHCLGGLFGDGVTNEPLPFDCVNEPLPFGCVNDPLPAGWTNEPLPFGCVNDPLPAGWTSEPPAGCATAILENTAPPTIIAVSKKPDTTFMTSLSI